MWGCRDVHAIIWLLCLVFLSIFWYFHTSEIFPSGLVLFWRVSTVSCWIGICYLPAISEAIPVVQPPSTLTPRSAQVLSVVAHYIARSSSIYFLSSVPSRVVLSSLSPMPSQFISVYSIYAFHVLHFAIPFLVPHVVLLAQGGVHRFFLLSFIKLPHRLFFFPSFLLAEKRSTGGVSSFRFVFLSFSLGLSRSFPSFMWLLSSCVRARSISSFSPPQFYDF
ncbi:hypothetical protein VTN00DRAFT_4422 [Thermoascus crustaceus]|uniref:uncharacterized protein n=1 Tax=Thermoascus crustaceus TaxID=5088 RepID=UPI003742DC3A